MLQSVKAVVFAGLGTLLVGASMPAAAQQIDANTIIDFHVNLEEFNQSVGGAVKEGGRYTMTINGRGAYALTAVVADLAARRVNITVHRASNEKAQDFRAVETVTATVGTPVPLKAIPRASVVVEGIRRAQASGEVAGMTAGFASNSSRVWEPVRATALFGSCCVTCGNVTACGCAVSGDCGSCCSDSCCPPIRIEANSSGSTPAPTFYRFADAGCRKPVPDRERLFTGSEGVRQVALREN